MNADTFCTACFSGYRPEKFSFPLLDENNLEFLRLQSYINKSIIKALKLGYNFFLCGMARGFDLLCADILLDIREQHEQYRNISLTAVLPYASHTFAVAWGELHRIVKQCSNQVVIVSTEYKVNCYEQRNRYMIENSSHLICYWDGIEGGTEQTISMAKARGLTIQNVSPIIKPTQKSFTVVLGP